MLGGRLAEVNASLRDRRSGEVVVLVTGAGRAGAAAAVITAARRASPRPLAIVDLLASRGSDGEPAWPLAETFVPRSATHAMERLDALAATHRTVALAVRHDDPELGRPSSRRTHSRARGPGGGGRARARPRRDVPRRGSGALLRNGGDRHAGRRGPGSAPLRRRASRRGTWPGSGVIWPGRSSVSPGAGGAKCFAHAGVLQALEGAGYEVDYVAGAAWGRWSPLARPWADRGPDRGYAGGALRPQPVVDAVFRKGAAGGREIFARIFRETTADRAFVDLTIPATVMTADLASRSPAPIRAAPHGRRWWRRCRSLASTRPMSAAPSASSTPCHSPPCRSTRSWRPGPM